MTSIRAGVVGVGHLGYHHARLYSSMDAVDLVGVVDIDTERARNVAREFDTRNLDSIEALLSTGVDAVSVAVPTSEHFSVVTTFLEGGVDVLVEKPIAKSVREAAEMVRVASEAGRILQVGHVERFNGAVIALMESIQKPRFIECHRLSPYPNRGDDVSVIHDLMIHDLDIVLALDGSEVVSMDAIGVPVFSASEDIANARIRFASGCVANVTSSRVSMEKMRKIRIFEDNAYVSTDYSAQEVLVYRKKPGLLPAGASPMESISVESLSVQRGEPLRLELESFIESVRTRGRPAVSGEEGMRALTVAEELTSFIRNSS